MRFYGRENELRLLKNLKNKDTASLVCVTGRRRIGKSYLIQKFASFYKSYIEIQGLGPHSEESSLKDQLAHFAFELSHQLNIRKPHFEDWDDAFSELANLTKKGEYLIFLDEISWMAKDDPLFSAKLKSAWDTRLKKNPKLILVLCGSVSSWIENNLLKNANFEGRISLEINLLELNLFDSNFFFGRHMGPYEKMTILSTTGGVPKYLEEVSKKDSANTKLAELCLSPQGILFNDFEKIFTDIFQRKSKSYEKIIRAAIDKKLSPMELSKKCHTEYNSDFLESLHILELSGFLSRDYYFKPDGGNLSKFSHLRVKDNYLRFYLKVIEPLKIKIKSGGKNIDHLSVLKNIDAIMGYQFENIILGNRGVVQKLLNIADDELVSSAPYVQKKLATNKGACQIDLLIHTRSDVFYLCEIKCQKHITTSVINEVKKKMNHIKIPKRSSLKPVLIYLGELDPDQENKIDEFFYKRISFEEMIN